MANTKSVGDISEAVVLAEFLKAGFPVLLPFGDNQRYDMVVEVSGHFLRVQCKTASVVEAGAVIRFNTRSTNPHPRNGSYRNEADLFAAYSPHTGQVYVLPVDEVGEVGVWLRLAPARNNQQRKVRLAADHTLAAWVQRLVDRGQDDCRRLVYREEQIGVGELPRGPVGLVEQFDEPRQGGTLELG